MLTETDINDPTSIERILCVPMDSLKRIPMDKELADILITLYMAKGLNIPEDGKPHLFHVIEKRLQYALTFKIPDQRLILLLCAIAQTPGVANMYLYYMQWWCYKHMAKELTLEKFCQEVFPFGFFDDGDLQAIWDNQKCSTKGGDSNLIDYGQASESIQHSN